MRILGWLVIIALALVGGRKDLRMSEEAARRLE